jgi:hypothetical protein
MMVIIILQRGEFFIKNSFCFIQNNHFVLNLAILLDPASAEDEVRGAFEWGLIAWHDVYTLLKLRPFGCYSKAS